jgi:hypothetical protein
MRNPLCFVVTILLAAAVGLAAQSNPFDGMDARGRAYSDPALYAQLKTQWLARVDARPDDVDVLEGAADFFVIRERALAQQLIERARSLQPTNPKWPSKLAHIHSMNDASRRDLVEARAALAERERAHAMTPAAQRGLAVDLPLAAFNAEDFAKARAYAEQLLAEAASQPRTWNYGNAVHKGNLVLGRLAARDGRIAEAMHRLRAAGETPGSPQLDSFGPNMTLAKDLLELGEKEAVLAYFELCRVFWKLGGASLDRWTSDVKAGRIPNFGANLQY